MNVGPEAAHQSGSSLNLQHGTSTASLNMQPGGESGSLHAQPGGGSGFLHMQPGGGPGSLHAQPGGGSGFLPMQPGGGSGSLHMQPVPSSAALPPGVSLQPLPLSAKSAVISMQPTTPLSAQQREDLKHDYKAACALCQSIFVCLCCCWMIGIVSIVFAVMAMAASKAQAKKLWLITDIVNLSGVALGTLLFAAALVAVASTQP